MFDFLTTLNPQQRDAVTFSAKHALVLAGAGSGKTRVLIARIAWLIKNNFVEPYRILAVTFTNKAARQMQSRLEELLGRSPAGIWVGTFHGLCNRLLRLHNVEAALPRTFQILDSADQLAAIKRVLKKLDLDEERYSPRQLAQFINVHKEQGVRAAQAQNLDGNPYIDRHIAIYGEYEAQCQREGVVDFAELILRAYELLCRNQPLRDHYRDRFRHILVDEFQDTNRLQYAWLKCLAQMPSVGVDEAADGAVIFAVGDDDQSIYRFRGAEVGNMADFERRFADGRVVRLEQNYRSHGNILRAANALISQNHNRLGKNLWTESDAGAPITVCSARSDFDEARWIVNTACERFRAGVPYREIAVLYRSNAQSRVLEHQFFTAGVPYRVYGGLRFFERQEVKHALAYLRLTVNSGDDNAFLRIVNFPVRGIGARTLENLQNQALRESCSLYDCARRAETSGRAKAALAEFVGLIEGLRTEMAEANMTLPECVGLVLERSGLAEYYRNGRRGEEGAERLANLDELVNAATSFTADDLALDDDPLSAFLAHASLEAGDEDNADGDRVQLMTVHAAKGLEFDAVFVSGLEEGLFPHDNAIAEQAGLEEERRLFYVAMTRARQGLYLSWSGTRLLHGEPRFSTRSSFLDALPDDLIRSVKIGEMVGFDSRTTRYRSGGENIASSNGSGFFVGQTVTHPSFGEGVITAAEGYGDDARVQVSFADGNKWLLVSKARLQTME